MSWAVRLGDQLVELEEVPELSSLELSSPAPGVWQLQIGNRCLTFALFPREAGLVLWWRGQPYLVQVEPKEVHALRRHLGAKRGEEVGGRAVVAHMPGLVTRVRVSEGQAVSQGDGLFVIEAMKMENELAAPVAGVVRALQVEPGQQVDKGFQMCRIQPEAGS